MTSSAPSSEFVQAFENVAGPEHVVSFARFMELALYHPDVGYYRQDRSRVGYGGTTDFFTASTSGPIFGELIAAACVHLLGDRDPKQHTFVEIGAETAGGVLQGVPHPFGATRVLRVGSRIDLTGPSIVFSNELFDAQPFRRFRFTTGTWRELGVAWRNGAFVEAELPADATEVPAQLPSSAPEGYLFDAPLAATALADEIAGQPWTGLFVACDYGKSWQELAEATPAGTARAYYRHTQSNDLLARPGEQDLTCHVCWDWLADTLRRRGFSAPEVQTQESFFIHHAESYIAPAIAADAARFTPRKQALLQLLHGAHLGQKFQVLHGLR